MEYFLKFLLSHVTRFFASVLLATIFISGPGCMGFCLGPARPGFPTCFYYHAEIDPLPGNYGRWSQEEIDTVLGTIATLAKYYGFKRGLGKQDNWAYRLSGGDFDWIIDVWGYEYDRGFRPYHSLGLSKAS